MKEAEQARSKHLSHAVIADALLDLEPNDCLREKIYSSRAPKGIGPPINARGWFCSSKLAGAERNLKM